MESVPPSSTGSWVMAIDIIYPIIPYSYLPRISKIHIVAGVSSCLKDNEEASCNHDGRFLWIVPINTTGKIDYFVMANYFKHHWDMGIFRKTVRQIFKCFSLFKTLAKRHCW